MKPFSFLTMLFLLTLVACQPGDRRAEAMKQILDAEHAFATMAMEEGVPAAFSYYAANDAVINLNDHLLVGIDSIRIHYNQEKYKNLKLIWKPDFVNAAASGDLGYTYGHYSFEVADSTGQVKTGSGVFHTVWKKQLDGNWKFVWD